MEETCTLNTTSHFSGHLASLQVFLWRRELVCKKKIQNTKRNTKPGDKLSSFAVSLVLTIDFALVCTSKGAEEFRATSNERKRIIRRTDFHKALLTILTITKSLQVVMRSKKISPRRNVSPRQV